MLAKEEAKVSELQEKLELKKIEYVTDKNENNIGLNEYIDYIIDKKLIDNKDIAEIGEANSKYVTLENEYVFLVEKILETGELKITYQGKVGKLKPIIVNIEVLEKSTNSIKVQVNTRLTKNATYTYYIAEEEDKEYKKIKKIDSNIYEYTELKQGKKYKIKVDVEIKDGGKTYSEIIVSLGSIEGLTSSNITFTYSPSGWTNGNVEVTIETKVTGYTLQYKTEKTGSSGEVSDWTNYTGAITLTRNQAIYARTIDSSGQPSKEHATGNIDKIDKTVPTIGAVSGTITIGKTGTITVSNIEDIGGSGLKGIYVSPVNTSTVPTATSVTWTPNTSNTYTKTVSENGTYYVWVIDNANNISSVKSCTVTIQTAVAKIGTTNYSSVANAVSAASTSTITLLVNQTENVTIPSGKNITLELNNKTLTGTITNNGTLTVSGGTINNKSNLAILNNNVCTINSGTIKLDGKSINNKGTLNVTYR